jgi:GNAT superfamily N-acetyltransferase
MSYPDVRRAQMPDQEAVGRLWHRLLTEQAEHDDRMGVADDALDRWQNDFPVWLEDETARIYVAEGEGEVVGFAAARRWGPPPIYEESSEVYLDELYVRPDDRRYGYGTQLVHAVRDWADQLGARRLRLRVLVANEAARAFWSAQDAVPLSLTLTIEGEEDEDETPDEGSKKIGFTSERSS